MAVVVSDNGSAIRIKNVNFIVIILAADWPRDLAPFITEQATGQYSKNHTILFFKIYFSEFKT
jgi:hypothetical protein